MAEESINRGHTKRQNLDGSHLGKQYTGHQKPTASTSITRRQQEISNARLFAGARASVTLKASLMQQQKNQAQKSVPPQKRLKQTSSALYQNYFVQREG